jgi:hypothetical protein
LQQYGSQHTDAIVTENIPHAMRFLREVDRIRDDHLDQPVSPTLALNMVSVPRLNFYRQTPRQREAGGSGLIDLASGIVFGDGQIRR